VRALVVYLYQVQFVSTQRTCEALAELCGCEISAGTLARWVQQAATVLKPTPLQIADGILASPLQHGDETGVRVKGQLHWLHVNSTRWLTHLAWHRRRGLEALEAIGIWPRFTGRSMRDRWASYDQYRCAHSICGARASGFLAGVPGTGQQARLSGFSMVCAGRHQPQTDEREAMAAVLGVRGRSLSTQAKPALGLTSRVGRNGMEGQNAKESICQQQTILRRRA
jgi:hypothetical protein